MTKRNSLAVALRAFLAVLCLALMTATAQAADHYEIGAYGGGSASTGISFTVPFGVAPDVVTADGTAFTYSNVPYFQGGNFDCPCTGDVTFYVLDADNMGGVDTPAGYYAGVQMFTGPASAPLLIVGNFPITYLKDGSFYSGGSGEVQITLVRETPAVPEPASWALLIAGFAMAGSALRHRHQGAPQVRFA